MAGICELECVGHRLGDEPLTLPRRYSCELPQLYEALEEWNSVMWVSQQLKGIKGKNSFFS